MLVRSSMLAGGLFLAACGPQGDYQPSFAARAEAREGLAFAVYPGHNPTGLSEVYGPLAERLSARLADTGGVRLVASRDYAAFDRRLAAGEFDFAISNPFQTILAIDNGCRVIAKMGDDESFHGLIIVRRDTNIRDVSDLRGVTISYPAPTAVAATMMPQLFLQSHGLDVMRDTRSLYVGSQESSIMSVYLRSSEAAATWPPAWQAFVREHPEIAAELEVRWRTAALVNNAVVACARASPARADAITAELVRLGEDAAGRSILAQIGVSRFERAGNDDYDAARRFFRTFERSVRPPAGG